MSTPDKPVPLPCPFCGYVGLDFSEQGSTFRWGTASCEGCGATVGETRKHEDWHRDAIEAWNRRATPTRVEPVKEADVSAIRDAALEEAAKAVEKHDKTGREWIPKSLWGQLSSEAAARIRALRGGTP